MGVNGDRRQLIVDTKWCKGCGVCAQYCPKKILEVKHGKIQIAKPEECIKCGLCEQRCPDYAIYLKGEK